MPFEFLDPGPLIDDELELIPPEARWIDEVMRTCAHPTGRGDPTAATTRSQIEAFLKAAPHGRFTPAAGDHRVPQYQFWMRLDPRRNPPVLIAGSVGLRVGDNEDLRMYLGHFGYNVYPAARGHHYALRSCKLLLPLARRHGMRELWITCNPDNIASQRTCEKLGATLVNTVDLPPGHVLFERGERRKCRYRLVL